MIDDVERDIQYYTLNREDGAVALRFYSASGEEDAFIYGISLRPKQAVHLATCLVHIAKPPRTKLGDWLKMRRIGKLQDAAIEENLDAQPYGPID